MERELAKGLFSLTGHNESFNYTPYNYATDDDTFFHFCCAFIAIFDFAELFAGETKMRSAPLGRS